MNKAIYRISLDIHDTGSQVSLSVKKGDTARSIHIILTEKGKPYKIAEGCFATLSGKKADGNYLYNDCIIKDNIIIYDFTKQTTPVVGKVDCEVNLYDANGDNITSPHFVLMVEDKVYNGEEIESSPEATALIQAVFQAEESEQKAKNSAEEAKGYRNETATMLDSFNGIQPWQSNTEYKVGDVVYATSIGYNGATMDVIAKCTQAHTSSYGIFVDGDKWRTENIYAYSSICDGNGNVIEETYATKEELAEAIGQALEGDY